jgi:2-phospho-L-lactate/phosphoenolpyruvate guanylyltransferase
MRTQAILPIKSFPDAKRRLMEELSPGPRRALVEAMFSDVLVALRRAERVDEIVVVSSDRDAQEIAGGYGAAVLDDEQLGHSEAASLAISAALEGGVDQVALVPGDCPLLDPGELDALLSRATTPPNVFIVPDRHGTGTNALVLTPPNALTPAFGLGSCDRHASSARLAGTAHEIVEVPSLGLDIDTPEDLTDLIAALEQTHGGAAHTRGMLNQMLRSRT